MQVFHTAGAGDADSPDLGILIDRSGALRIVPAEGWRPEALQAHYGATTVFHVSHSGSAVKVVGRSRESSCVLETGHSAPGIVYDETPRYTVLAERLLTN